MKAAVFSNNLSLPPALEMKPHTIPVNISSSRIHTFAEYKTEEERGAPAPLLPPPHCSFENGWSNIDTLYVVGKGIYRRLRFYLDIWKIFRFRDVMSNFREMGPEWLSEQISNF